MAGRSGVTSLTPILIGPFLGANVWQWRFDAEGQVHNDTNVNPLIPVEVAGEEFFRTFDIPILRGRGFQESDGAGGPYVAVISESVARRFWPGQDPIGKRIRLPGEAAFVVGGGSWRTVVGVLGDVHYRTLREATPTVYLPWRQSYWQGGFAIKTRADLASVLPQLRREARAFDPQLSLWHAEAMQSLLGGPLAQPRLTTLLLCGFALIAFLLATIGLYGIMASAVKERTREIGIRLALGATPEHQRREVLMHALRITAIGAGVGITGALLSARVLRGLLFEVNPLDPVTLAGVCLLLMSVSLAAASVPAQRATRVDPMRAIRAE